MPVLDVRSLSSKQLATLATHYDALSHEDLKPLAQLKMDPVRCEIDRAVGYALTIPDLSFIHELLEREPGLSATEIAPREIIVEDEEE